jgi:pSer/pThr/pTyr-binding forkhead associated (FHA) protein
MGILKTTLSQLEARLQSLIEGGAGRVLPLRGGSHSFYDNLVLAMRSGCQVDGNGNRIAPNLYTLDVHPSVAQSLRENQELLDDFANVVERAGLGEGLYFITPPVIKINAVSDLQHQQVNVRAWIIPQQVEQTNTMVQTEATLPRVPANAYLILDGKRIFSLTQAVVNIGRRPDNHIVIEDRRVSRLHAQLRVVQGVYMIFDLDSAGGTFVNGIQLQQCALFPGDVISLAGVELIYGYDLQEVQPSSSGPTEPITSFP